MLAKLSELQLRAFMMAVGRRHGFIFRVIANRSGRKLSSGWFGGWKSEFQYRSPNRPLPPKGFSIARMERDGVVATRGIEVKDGEQVTGVRVVLSYGSATLRGVVVLDNGPLPAGTRVSIQTRKTG